MPTEKEEIVMGFIAIIFVFAIIGGVAWAFRNPNAPPQAPSGFTALCNSAVMQQMMANSPSGGGGGSSNGGLINGAVIVRYTNGSWGCQGPYGTTNLTG